MIGIFTPTSPGLGMFVSSSGLALPGARPGGGTNAVVTVVAPRRREEEEERLSAARAPQ